MLKRLLSFACVMLTFAFAIPVAAQTYCVDAKDEVSVAADQLDGQMFVATDAAGQYVFGNTKQDLHPQLISEIGKVADFYPCFKFTKVTDASECGVEGNLYTIQMYNVNGNFLSEYGLQGYLNFQPEGSVIFALDKTNTWGGATQPYGQDCPYGALWQVSYEEGQGYVIMNVARKMYVSPASGSPVAEKAYVRLFSDFSVAEPKPVLTVDAVAMADPEEGAEVAYFYAFQGEKMQVKMFDNNTAVVYGWSGVEGYDLKLELTAMSPVGPDDGLLEDGTEVDGPSITSNSYYVTKVTPLFNGEPVGETVSMYDMDWIKTATGLGANPHAYFISANPAMWQFAGQLIITGENSGYVLLDIALDDVEGNVQDDPRRFYVAWPVPAEPAELAINGSYNDDNSSWTGFVNPITEGNSLMYTLEYGEEDPEYMAVEGAIQLAWTPGKADEFGVCKYELLVIECDAEGKIVAQGFEEVSLVKPTPKVDIVVNYNEDNSQARIFAYPTEEGNQVLYGYSEDPTAGVEGEVPATGLNMAFTPGMADPTGVCKYELYFFEVTAEMDIVATAMAEVSLVAPREPQAGESDDDPIELANGWAEEVEAAEVGADEAGYTHFKYVAQEDGKFVFSCGYEIKAFAEGCGMEPVESAAGVRYPYGKSVKAGEVVTFSAYLPQSYEGVEDEELYPVESYVFYAGVEPEAVIAAGDYYIKNVETGKFLNGANSWGTKASVTTYGQLMTLAIVDGKYTIDSHISNGENKHYLGTNGYVDSEPAAYTIEANGDGTFSIKDVNYLAYELVDGQHQANWSATEVTPAAKWQILSKDELIVDAISKLEEVGSADLTSLVFDSNFSRNNTYFNQWIAEDGAASPAEKGGDNANQNAEKWGGKYQKFCTSQTITGLPNGVYVVSAQGFYRYNNTSDNTNEVAATAHADGTEIIFSKLFANNDTVALKSIADADAVEMYGKMPFSQIEAGEAFAKGLYRNEVPVLVTNGTLKIGIAKTGHLGCDWTVWDNVNLFYLGERELPELPVEVVYNADNTACTFTAEPTEEGTELIYALDGVVMTLVEGPTTVAPAPEQYDETGVAHIVLTVYEVPAGSSSLVEAVASTDVELIFAKPYEPVPGDSDENPIVLATGWSDVTPAEAIGGDEAGFTHFSYTAAETGTFVFSCGYEIKAWGESALEPIESTAGVRFAYGKAVKAGDVVAFSAYLPQSYEGVEDEELYPIEEYAFYANVEAGVISNLLVNGDFKDGKTGWEFTTTGDGWSDVLCDEPKVVEAYAGWGDLLMTDFAMSQKVSLAAGVYKLSAYAFYRYGVSYDVDPAKSCAQLFAGENAIDVATLGSIVKDAYPNDVNAASAAFAAGEYLNEIEFTVEQDAEIEVGIKGVHELKQSWFIAGPMTLVFVKPLETKAGDSAENPIVLATGWSEETVPASVGKDASAFTHFSYTAENDGVFVFSCGYEISAFAEGCGMEPVEATAGVRYPYGKAVKAGDVVEFAAILPVEYPGVEDEQLYPVESYTFYANVEAETPIEKVDLTLDMYYEWDNTTADANVVGPGAGEYHIGESTGLPYGNGSVLGKMYANLTDCIALELTVTEGTPRILMNRPAMEDSGTADYIEIKSEDSPYVASVVDGVWTIDIAKIVAEYGFAHLNCIKGANWANTTITSAKLVRIYDPTAIKSVETAVKAAGIYSVSGAKLNTLQKGLNIVIDENGNAKKIMVK